MVKHNNTSFDATLAHLQELNNLRVVSIYFGRGRVRTVLVHTGIRDKVNLTTANAYNLNGEHSVSHFVEGHTCDTPYILKSTRPLVTIVRISFPSLLGSEHIDTGDGCTRNSLRG